MRPTSNRATALRFVAIAALVKTVIHLGNGEWINAAVGVVLSAICVVIVALFVSNDPHSP